MQITIGRELDIDHRDLIASQNFRFFHHIRTRVTRR
jgi:hypothetical protein